MALRSQLEERYADVGTDGSAIQSNNIGAIFYSTYTSEQLPQIEASLGYGDLNFETKRIDLSETLVGNGGEASISVLLVLDSYPLHTRTG